MSGQIRLSPLIPKKLPSETKPAVIFWIIYSCARQVAGRNVFSVKSADSSTKLGTDLDKPLGQRAPAKANASVSSWRRTTVATLAVISVAAVAALIAFKPGKLSDGQTNEIAEVDTPSETPVNQPQTHSAPESDDVTMPGLSGANIETIVTDDGQTVTKFSPANRDTDDPIILSVDDTPAQNARFAHLPEPGFFEDTPDGRLPIRNSRGGRPMEVYARPWSGARGTRIAIVVSGLGLSQTGTQYAIQTLPEDMTLAFAASGNSLQRWMQDARSKGHEVLLQIAMEPFDYPNVDPGPRTLLVDRGADGIVEDLRTNLGRMTNYTGVLNFMGGRFMSDPTALEPLMRELTKRGLLFLDDSTSARTQSDVLAEALGTPHAFADTLLDAEVERGTILKKLDELERIARRNGTAIGMASGFRETVDALSTWTNEARARGIEFVAVSALVNDPEEQ